MEKRLPKAKFLDSLPSRVKAFSLVEMLVVLVLSSIVVAIIYVSYSRVQSFYRSVSKKYQTSEDFGALIYTIRKDINASDAVLKTEEGVSCVFREREVSYAFTPSYVVRRQSEVVDTFNCLNLEAYVLFSGSKVEQPRRPVDQVVLVVSGKEEDMHTFRHLKYYDQRSLMRYDLQDSIELQ